MESETSRLRAILSLTVDVLVTIASYMVALWARHMFGGWSVALPEYSGFLLFIIPMWVVALKTNGCYELNRALPATTLAFRVLRALALANLSLAMVVFFSKAHFMSRGVILLFFVINYVSLLGGRLLIVRRLLGHMRLRTIVVGTGERARHLAQTLEKEEGHEIVGFVGEAAAEGSASERFLGNIDRLGNLVAENAPIDEVAIALHLADLAAAQPAVDVCEARGVAIRLLVDPLGGESRKTSLEQVGDLNLLTTRMSPASASALFLKRAIDVVGAIVGLLLTAIVFPLVALALKLTSRGPILYRQERVGLNGRVFTIYKFRTMLLGAHEMRPQLAHLNETDGPHFKIKDDPRITRVGRFLRRTSLDEFPQFWSVLKGDMSLVGPRPFPIAEVEKHENDHYKRLSMKPGITGIWQTNGRSSVRDFAEILRMDEQYICNWSLWLDVKLMLKTIPVALGGKGAA